MVVGLSNHWAMLDELDMTRDSTDQLGDKKEYDVWEWCSQGDAP